MLAALPLSLVSLVAGIGPLEACDDALATLRADAAEVCERIATLDDVVAHYDDPPEAIIGHTDLLPLELSDRQAAALAAFLGVLDAAPRELASAEPSTAGAGAEAPMVTR